MPFVLSGNVGSATAATGFNVDNSCMFNSADSASMEKDAAAPTDNNKWTFSAWVKRSKLGTLQEIFYGEANSTNYCTIRFNDTSDTLTFKNRPGSTTSTLTTSAVFRDPNAWLHLVVVLDTSNGTAANRDIIYINGVRETNFSTESHSGDGDVCYINSDGDAMKISKGNSASFFNGYMAEVYFIDGQALAASDFGEFDEDSPTIWKPKDASGLTFGNNGFYLDFKASGNLGNDANGGTDLTESNLAATDQSTDTCTNNFSTLNSLIYITNAGMTLSEGNLKVVTSADAHRNAYGTMGVSSGKWYWEINIVDTTGDHQKIGVVNEDNAEINKTSPSEFSGDANGYAYRTDGQKENNDSASSYGNSYTDDDIIGVAMDLDNNKLYFSKNGTFQNSGDPTTGSTGTGSAFNLAANKTYFAAINQYGGNTSSFNFGSPPYAISSGNADANGHGNFEYAPPSGYFALCTKNLAEFG